MPRSVALRAHRRDRLYFSPAHHSEAADSLAELCLIKPGNIGGSTLEARQAKEEYKEGCSWVIADWNTDVIATPETVTSYFVQLDIYATIRTAALGQPVSRLELIFAGVEVPLGVVHDRR
ncbi:hypothetical protein [Corynebacterium sp. NML130628]|uniref:hypothetical protein n=1 Tax=Corynebacterium sp. NML130628 TaxID=1906333 RepID=UPI0008FB9565|nr:hypothetical protein [Corynebacterium sp. NML130628]OIR40228.1 hypothetical protein BJP07_09715 [Corynebacterium sp. NML130628]